MKPVPHYRGSPDVEQGANLTGLVHVVHFQLSRLTHDPTHSVFISSYATMHRFLQTYDAHHQSLNRLATQYAQRTPVSTDLLLFTTTASTLGVLLGIGGF